MSQEDESEVLDELFGDSEGEKETFTKIESEFDGNKRKGTSKRIAKESKNVEINKLEGNEEFDDKILEARRDFDEALSKLKGPRRRKENDSDSVNYDELAVNFINKMYDALKKDDEAVKAEKPALSKLKILDEVCETLNRKHLQEIFLDNQVLDVIKKWLEPNIRGHLSVPSLRKRLLEILLNLPIETVHLRESGIGKIVMFFYQRKSENMEIRKLSGDLITSWSRPILGTSLNYSEMIQSATNTSYNNKNDNDDDDGDGSNGASRNSDKSNIKRLQSENYKKMARSGALEREPGSDQKYRQIINRQKNRKRE